MRTTEANLQPIAPDKATAQYLEFLQIDGKAEATINNREDHLSHFLRWCEQEGIDNLNVLDGRDLSNFSTWRREDGDLKRTSLRSQLSSLRCFLKWAANHEAVSPSLYEKVMLPDVSGEENRRDTLLEPERARSVLEYLETYQYASRDHAVFLILWATGMRRGALTCLEYHYETQPMPNPVSWYVHHLPDRFHRAGVVANHAVELAIPFLYFAPQPVASVAGAVTVAFMGWLSLTGNFSFLNVLTMVLAVSTFSDATLSAVVPLSPPSVAPVALPLQGAVWLVVLVVAVLSYYPVRNLLSSGQAMNRGYDPLHLVNTYGAFGSITKTRYEIVVEGTRDRIVTDDTTWREYAFPGKPDEPTERPPQVAPYHHRLGWQLWFAAMSRAPRRHPWFVHLLAKLLAGDEGTKTLLQYDPFPEDPPRHVRAIRYRYEFTTPDERAETGRWWTRERVGTYYGPVSLSDSRFQSVLDRRGWDVEPPEQARTERTTAPAE